MFAKKKSYAHSKARRDRSVSLSASPAPSVVGTSVGRPSVPSASPPPSRDQVVMGGQPSVGVSVGCVGSAPSGSVRVLPHGIAPVPLLESAEVEVRVIASSLESDVTATVTWSALAHPPRLRNLPTYTPALAILIANAPVIEETRASIAHEILGNAPSTARGLGSAPTAPELLRSEAVSRDAVTRAAHRFLRRRSVLKSVPYVT